MNWKDKAAEYALECLPHESCGLLAIIKGKKLFGLVTTYQKHLMNTL